MASDTGQVTAPTLLPLLHSKRPHPIYPRTSETRCWRTSTAAHSGFVGEIQSTRDNNELTRTIDHRRNTEACKYGYACLALRLA
jgi:hypothetical protein